MKRTLLKGGVGIGVWSAPLLVLAQNAGELNALGDTLLGFINNTLIPLVFAIAFLVFIWGVARYFILSQGSDEGKEQGRSLMIWGIIGFFVMVALWGIVNILVGATGLGGENLQNVPNVPGLR